MKKSASELRGVTSFCDDLSQQDVRSDHLERNTRKQTERCILGAKEKGKEMRAFLCGLEG